MPVGPPTPDVVPGGGGGAMGAEVPLAGGSFNADENITRVVWLLQPLSFDDVIVHNSTECCCHGRGVEVCAWFTTNFHSFKMWASLKNIFLKDTHATNRHSILESISNEFFWCLGGML